MPTPRTMFRKLSVTCLLTRKALRIIIIPDYRMGLVLSGFAYVTLYVLSFSASNNLTVTVWRNKRIVYVLSTLSQLADNVQVTRIASNKDGRE